MRAIKSRPILSSAQVWIVTLRGFGDGFKRLKPTIKNLGGPRPQGAGPLPNKTRHLLHAGCGSLRRDHHIRGGLAKPNIDSLKGQQANSPVDSDGTQSDTIFSGISLLVGGPVCGFHVNVQVKLDAGICDTVRSNEAAF